jgi:hypothetical protein
MLSSKELENPSFCAVRINAGALENIAPGVQSFFAFPAQADG